MNIKQKRKSRRLCLLAYIVCGLVIFTGVGIYLSMNNCCATIRYTGILLSSVSVIGLAWVLLSSLYNYVKRTHIVVFGFIALYICGIATYQGIADGNNSIDKIVTRITAPINNTLSVFFPSRGSYSEANNIHFTTYYQLFHLASYFFFALVVFSFFGRKVLNRSGHLLVKYKNKNIFWGYSENGKALASDLENKTLDEQAIFILSNEIGYNSELDNLIFDQINDMNAIALYGDYDKIEMSAKRYSGHRHFFFTEDQDFNVRMALSVLDGLLQKGDTIEKTHLYVRSELETVETFFRNKLYTDKNEKVNMNVELHIYNHSDLTARQFVQNNPVLKHQSITINTIDCDVKGRFNLLILGCGWSGLELLKKSLCDAQFASKDFSFSATVIDNDFETKHGRYKYLFEQSKYNIEINPTNKNGVRVSQVNSETFYDWLNEDKHILNFDRIIVALGNDELNINTAIELTKFRMHYQTIEREFEKIFTHVRDFDKYKYYQIEKSLISVFGDLRQTNSCNVLINESMDNVGKLVNFVYSKYDVPLFSDAAFENKIQERTEIERMWANATIFNQASSRAVAMNIDNMVLLSGGIEEFYSRVQDPHFLELFAQMEHLRWNAFHFMNGIRKWEISDVANSKGKLSFQNELVKHICLISFEELDKASEKVNSLRDLSKANEDFKEVDRRIVRHFPFFIKYKNIH